MSKRSMISKVLEEPEKQTDTENLNRTKKSFQRWKWISNGVLLVPSPVSNYMTPTAGVEKLRPSTGCIKCLSQTLSVQIRAVRSSRLRRRLSTAKGPRSVRKVLRGYEANVEDWIPNRQVIETL